MSITASQKVAIWDGDCRAPHRPAQEADAGAEGKGGRGDDR